MLSQWDLFQSKTFQNTSTTKGNTINRIQAIFLHADTLNTLERAFFYFSSLFFYREQHGEWRIHLRWGSAISFIDDDDNEHTFIMPPQNQSISIQSFMIGNRELNFFLSWSLHHSVYIYIKSKANELAKNNTRRQKWK